eukprot:3918692-Pyramimonas_sp.AAC.1
MIGRFNKGLMVGRFKGLTVARFVGCRSGTKDAGLVAVRGGPMNRCSGALVLWGVSREWVGGTVPVSAVR